MKKFQLLKSTFLLLIGILLQIMHIRYMDHLLKCNVNLPFKKHINPMHFMLFSTYLLSTFGILHHPLLAGEKMCKKCERTCVFSLYLRELEKGQRQKKMTLHSYLNISPFAFLLSFLTAWHSVLE